MRVILALILSATPLSAHHAFSAAYDANKPVRLQDATVTSVQFVNPHSFVSVDVRQPDGRVENWRIELASPNTLTQRGFTKDTLKVGTRIGIDGFLAKDGSKLINGRALVLSDGNPVLVGSVGNGAPYDTTPRDTLNAYRETVRAPAQVPGAWWTNPATVNRLGLTDDQKVKIERAYENHRQTIVSTTAFLEKEEAQLSRLLGAETMDRSAILTQIDRVIQARSEVERANAAMTFEMREHLTRDQWSRLPRTAAPTIRLTAPEPVPGQNRGRGRGQ